MENELSTEKTMTVKEVAEVLGYQPDTIQKTAKRLESENIIGRIEIRSDSTHAMLLSKEQVQTIKTYLVPRDLTLKNKVESAITEIDRQKTMTTKELADYLNTSPKVVIENARKCLPEKIIENGKATLWTREEITIIIEQMKRSFNKPTFTESVKPVSTELTPALKIKQAMLLMQEGYEEELAIIKQRAEIAEQKCIEQKPKVEFFDAVADSKDAIDIGNVAKVLNNGTGRNRLFEILRNRHVLQNNNVPYQKYIDAGYFRVIEQKYGTPDGSVYVNIKTLVYQRGIDFIRKVCAENK